MSIETNETRCMQCGFNHALYMLEEFWEFYEPGIKENRLHSYKGIKLIIKKLIEYKREFFIKGKEVDIIFTKKELESVRSGKQKIKESFERLVEDVN